MRPIALSLMIVGFIGLVPVSVSAHHEPLLVASADDRQDRRKERGRSDERHDRRDCRQDEGWTGEDKRDCKQEEVRDGVRGHRDDDDDDD